MISLEAIISFACVCMFFSALLPQISGLEEKSSRFLLISGEKNYSARCSALLTFAHSISNGSFESVFCSGAELYLNYKNIFHSGAFFSSGSIFFGGLHYG